MAPQIKFILDEDSIVKPTEPGTYIGCIQVDTLSEGTVAKVIVKKQLNGPQIFPDLTLEEMEKILQPRAVYMRAYREGYEAFTKPDTKVEKLTPIQLEGYLAARLDIERCIANEREISKGD